jgi:preprotein translocase subunit SecG
VNLRRIAFSQLLPAACLAAWLLLVPVDALLIFLHLNRGDAATGMVQLGNASLSVEISRDELFQWTLQFTATRHAHLLSAASLPGAFIEPLLLFSTMHLPNWHPKPFTAEAWRAITAPIACLPFWWLAGAGVEAAFGKRKLSRGLSISGIVLLFVFLGIYLVLQFGAAEDDVEQMRWIVAGSALWTALLTAFPLAWLRQRRGEVLEEAEAED